MVPINKSLTIIKFDFLVIKSQHVEKQCAVCISEPDSIPLSLKAPLVSKTHHKPICGTCSIITHTHTVCVSDTDPHTLSGCNNQITTGGLIHRLQKLAQTILMGCTQHKEPTGAVTQCAHVYITVNMKDNC